jgi:hypothetical protein
MLSRSRERGDTERVKMLQKDLTGPPLPLLMAHLLVWHRELQRERGYSGMGDPLPLTSKDILAWQECYNRRPTVPEVEILRDLDTLWLNTRAELRSKK